MAHPTLRLVMNRPKTTPANNLDQSPGERKTESGMSLSMHDGVEVWCDCCSCEAEPYWVEALAKTDRENADG